MWWIVSCFMAIGYLSAKPATLLIDGPGSYLAPSVAVLFNRQEGLFFACYSRTVDLWFGGDIVLWGADGARSEADVVAVNPLYDVCVIKVRDTRMLDDLEAAPLASSMATSCWAHSLKTFYDSRILLRQSKKAFLPTKARYCYAVYPGQTVAFHATEGFVEGSYFVNDEGKIISMMHRRGGIPLSVLQELENEALGVLKGEDAYQYYALDGIGFTICQQEDGCGTFSSVVKVTAKECASKSALELGDIIYSVDDHVVGDDVVKMLHTLWKKQQIRCTVLRCNKKKDLSLHLVDTEDTFSSYFVCNFFVIMKLNRSMSQQHKCPEGTWVCVDKTQLKDRVISGLYPIRALNGHKIDKEYLRSLCGKPIDKPTFLELRQILDVVGSYDISQTFPAWNTILREVEFVYPSFKTYQKRASCAQ